MAHDDVPSALDRQERWAGEVTSVLKRLVLDVANIQSELDKMRVAAGVDEQAGSNRGAKIESLEKSVIDIYSRVNGIVTSCAARHGELTAVLSDIRLIRETLHEVSRDLQEHTLAYNAAMARMQVTIESFKETEKTVSELDRLISNWKGKMVMLMIIAGSVPAIVDVLWQILKDK